MNRNHFGRQTESFQAPLDLPFLSAIGDEKGAGGPFNAVFIRAPVVEKILPSVESVQAEEQKREATVVAPSRQAETKAAREAMSDHVDILGRLPGRVARLENAGMSVDAEKDAGDIVAVKQGNVFGTSFHPELTSDPRIHLWWLKQVEEAINKAQAM